MEVKDLEDRLQTLHPAIAETYDDVSMDRKSDKSKSLVRRILRKARI
jgi:hypothetical protein